MAHLLEQIRDYLIAEGVAEAAQAQRTGGAVTLANDGTLPVVLVDPRDGPWEPSGDVRVVLSLRRNGQVPMQVREGFVEDALVEVVARAVKAPDLEDAQRSVRRVLDDVWGIVAGGVRLEWSRLYAGERPLLRVDGRAFGSVQTFRVAVRVVELEA